MHIMLQVTSYTWPTGRHWSLAHSGPRPTVRHGPGYHESFNFHNDALTMRQCVSQAVNANAKCGNVALLLRAAGGGRPSGAGRRTGTVTGRSAARCPPLGPGPPWVPHLFDVLLSHQETSSESEGSSRTLYDTHTATKHTMRHRRTQCQRPDGCTAPRVTGHRYHSITTRCNALTATAHAAMAG